jgi:hypothetical protein
MVSLSRPDRSGRAGRAYRRLWWCLAISVAGTGSVVSLLSVSGWILGFAVAISLAVTALVAKAIENALEAKLPFSRATLMTVIVAPAAIAFTGWIALIEVWAMPLPVLIGLSHPLVARYLVQVGRRLSAQTAMKNRQPDIPPPVTAIPPRQLQRRTVTPVAARCTRPGISLPSTGLRDLSDQELCHAWRRSFLILQDLMHCRDLPGQSHVVGVRQGYLDEMERRNPGGFSRWLAAGARPASDPSRYLSTTEPMTRSLRPQASTPPVSLSADGHDPESSAPNLS